MPNKRPPVSEPAMVVDTFATGMLPPVVSGGVVRLAFYADRMIGDEDERVIVFRLTMTHDAFLETLAELMRTIGAPM